MCQRQQQNCQTTRDKCIQDLVTKTNWTALGSDAFIHLILCLGNVRGLILVLFVRPICSFGLHFLPPKQRTCFMFTLINFAINKHKFCQEKSGMNQFHLCSSPHLHPALQQPDGFYFSTAAHPSTTSISLQMTKTLFLNQPCLLLSRRQHVHLQPSHKIKEGWFWKEKLKNWPKLTVLSL